MYRSMVDIQSAAAEIRRGIKKKIEDIKKSQGKNIMSASATKGGHKSAKIKKLILLSSTLTFRRCDG